MLPTANIIAWIADVPQNKLMSAPDMLPPIRILFAVPLNQNPISKKSPLWRALNLITGKPIPLFSYLLSRKPE